MFLQPASDVRTDDHDLQLMRPGVIERRRRQSGRDPATLERRRHFCVHERDRAFLRAVLEKRDFTVRLDLKAVCVLVMFGGQCFFFGAVCF